MVRLRQFPFVGEIVGAAIGRPPTNCVAICWFSAGKQCVIALRRCDFGLQNHAGDQWSPLHLRINCPGNGNFVVFLQKTIYIYTPIVYDNGEQSRRCRVKCHRDGELPGGRRKFPRWRFRTRCPYRISSFMRGDTRSGAWSGCLRCLAQLYL